MAVPDVQSLLALDLETRLALAQQLWDSIVDVAGPRELPLSERERALLDERIREDEEDPNSAIPLAAAKARLHRAP